MSKLTASEVRAKRFSFIRRDQRLHPTERLIVLEILDHDYGHSNGFSYPTQATLARMVGCALSKVQTAIKHARDLGYFSFNKMPKSHQFRIMYVINYAQIDAWVVAQDSVSYDDPDLSEVGIPTSHRLDPHLPQVGPPPATGQQAPNELPNQIPNPNHPNASSVSAKTQKPEAGGGLGIREDKSKKPLQGKRSPVYPIEDDPIYREDLAAYNRAAEIQRRKLFSAGL